MSGGAGGRPDAAVAAGSVEVAATSAVAAGTGRGLGRAVSHTLSGGRAGRARIATVAAIAAAWHQITVTAKASGAAVTTRAAGC